MKIQSLSIVVPNKACVNQCAFSDSRMRKDNYQDRISNQNSFAEIDYKNRLAFARDNNCNTVMLTGTSEPQQNMQFLRMFGRMNRELSQPFRCIEMQTTGTLINDNMLDIMRNEVGISTISLSIASFNDELNNKYIGTTPYGRININGICRSIKDAGFNLRISVNLTEWFECYKTNAKDFFQYCKLLGVDQVTMRILYDDGTDSEPSDWVRNHKLDMETTYALVKYVTDYGKPLEKLEYGRTKYSLHGMSTVIDDDCMAEELTDTYKYLILRPDCRLYSKWDDKASLIF